MRTNRLRKAVLPGIAAPNMPKRIATIVCDQAAARSESLSQLSRMVGRNVAYLQQFVERGTPRQLPEDVRLALAQHWQIDERLLGARDPWTPATSEKGPTCTSMKIPVSAASTARNPQISAISSRFNVQSGSGTS
jgi:hypothetical protein